MTRSLDPLLNSFYAMFEGSFPFFVLSILFVFAIGLDSYFKTEKRKNIKQNELIRTQFDDVNKQIQVY